MKVLYKLSAFLMALCVSQVAIGLSISPSDPPAAGQWQGPPSYNPLNSAQVETALGLQAGSLVEVYKSDFVEGQPGGSDGKTFAGSYTTTFTGFKDTVDLEDPTGATIVWNGEPNPYITGNPIYLGVKDGNHSPYWYVFDISSWSGKETIELSGFWALPSQGAISHVSIFTGRVPDGGTTAALLGLVLLGMGILHRARK